MTNPLTLIPRRGRLALYLLYALLGPVLTYTRTRGWTGDAELTLWVGLGTALGVTAAANLTPEAGAIELLDDPENEA